MDELIILQKMYDLYLWIYPALGRYPKHEKFVLNFSCWGFVAERYSILFAGKG